MPHLTRAPTLNPGPAVTPIAGNTEEPGATYDYSTGQALYAVYNPTNEAFECWRTTDGYLTLATENDSVEYLSTIVTGKMRKPNNAGLTWIDGTLYCMVVGVHVPTARAGQWIYEDTGGGGAGPWVLQSTVESLDISGIDGGADQDGREWPNVRWGGEILNLSGRWVITVHDFRTGDYGPGPGIRFDSFFQIRASDDEGGSWATLADPGIGLGVGMAEGTNSWSKFDGKWYASVRRPGSAAANSHYYTTDGSSVTSFDPASLSGDSTRPFIFSQPDRIFRERGDVSWVESAPESDPTWTVAFNLGTYGMFPADRASAHWANIGPTDRPFIAAMAAGEVLGVGAAFGGGWRISHHH